MEELSKQLSTQLNETITIISEDYLYLEDKKYKIIINSEPKSDISLIIKMYNEVRESKNNINNEFNLDGYINTHYDEDNVITYINFKIGKIKPIDGDEYIISNNYLELYEKVKKILELKNKLESLYGIIEEIDNAEFDLTIDDDIIDISYCIYYYDKNNNLDCNYSFSITTNMILIFQIYNQFRNYINSFIKIFDKDDNINHEIVSMKYLNNNIIIYICNSNNYIINIKINSIKCDGDISSLLKIYEEVKNYSNELYLKINKNSTLYHVSVIYDDDYLIKNIDIKYNNNIHICANNYIELTEKVENILESDRLEILERENKLIMIFKKKLNKDIIIKQINKSSFTILGKVINTEYKIKIYVNCIDDIDKIIKIYKEVKKFRKNINSDYELDCYIETEYIDYCINKIIIKCDDNIINSNDYLDCKKNIKAYVIKKKQKEIKLKYGEDAIWDVSYSNDNNNHIFKLEIVNVNKTFINLLDIVPYYQRKKIVNGFIKNINVFNGLKIMNLLEYDHNSQSKKYFNIYISGCLSLININNFLKFNTKATDCIYNLKIENCPSLEFIESYNNFSEIYIGFLSVEVINEEKKSLQKDQREYALVIQSLLKKINKLENKTIENE